MTWLEFESVHMTDSFYKIKRLKSVSWLAIFEVMFGHVKLKIVFPSYNYILAQEEFRHKIQLNE